GRRRPPESARPEDRVAAGEHRSARGNSDGLAPRAPASSVRIQRHFHVIHHEARRVPRARVYRTTRADRAAQKTIDVDLMRATDDAVMFVTSAGAIIRDARAGLRPVAAG